MPAFTSSQPTTDNSESSLTGRSSSWHQNQAGPHGQSLPTSLEVPRVLGHVLGDETGPTLVCVGGLHGNEPSGILAAQRVLATLQREAGAIRGQFLALAGNRQALMVGQRYLESDLNRIWSEENVQRLRQGRSVPNPDEQELLELDLELQQAISSGSNLFLLDLHSTSGPGPSFVVLEDSLANRAFGLAFPAPLVVGIEEELSGTLYHYMSRHGVVGITVETGSHNDPTTIDRAEAAIWIALEASGILPDGHPRADAGREMLASEKGSLPDVVEVHYRHALENSSVFQMEPGYRGFQAVFAGETLATQDGDPVRASDDGFILMPLYQPQGNDGFFLVRAIHPTWLKLSALLRRVHIERIVHWLPGVRRAGGSTRRFLVDRGTARWFALELFHLLGFHREGPAERQIVMVRRNDG